NNVEIYGGFNATETNLDQRDWTTNETVLQGNGNSVFRNEYTGANPLTNTAVLDGFTITGGNADYGGGMYNAYASPILTNVTITGNTADDDGGGMYNAYASPILTNVIITDNTANSGGGIYHHSGNTSVFTNITIARNSPNAIFAYGWTYWNNSIVWGGVDGNNYVAKNSLIEGSNNTDNGNIDATGITSTDIFAGPDSG